MELITKEDCQETIIALNELKSKFTFIIRQYKPALNGERYMTGDEVCQVLRVTKRTLQEYRDQRVIPYIPLFGKMLYRESDIMGILDENYISKI